MRPTLLSLDAERWLEATKRANRQALKMSMEGWIDGTVVMDGYGLSVRSENYTESAVAVEVSCKGFMTFGIT